MMGGGYKEPPKFLYKQKLHHSGDGLANSTTPWTDEGDYNERDNLTSVHINETGTKVFGYATDDDPTDNQGAIYEFSLSNGVWEETARITGSVGANVTGSAFGLSCVSAGDYLFVGAPYHDDAGFTNNGAVFIFHSSSAGWQEVQKILGSGRNGDNGTSTFGSSLEVSEDGQKLVVAAFQDSGTAGGTQGALYIFESGSSGYVETQRIEHTGVSSKQGDRFGCSIGMSSDGEKIVAGAYGASDGGHVFIFESGSSGYTQTQAINSGESNGSYFGFSVDMTYDGQRIAVGHPLNNEGSSNNGAIYIYDYNGTQYSLVQSIKSTEPDDLTDKLGYYVQLGKKVTGASTLHILVGGTSGRWKNYIYKDFGLGEGFEQDHVVENPNSNVFAKVAGSHLSKDLSCLAVSAPQERDVVDGDAYLAGAIHMFEYSDEY